MKGARFYVFKSTVMKSILLMVFGVLLLFPGCKKASSVSGDHIYHMWEWVQSSGGVGGGIQTPGTEGYTQAIQFDENGNYTRYRDGAAVHSGTYSLNSSTSVLDNEVYQMIQLDDGSPAIAVTLLNESQLTVREDCFDCFIHRYRR